MRPRDRIIARIPTSLGRTIAVAAKHDAIVLMLDGVIVPSFVVGVEAMPALIEVMRAFVGDAPCSSARWNGDGVRPPGVPRGRTMP